MIKHNDEQQQDKKKISYSFKSLVKSWEFVSYCDRNKIVAGFPYNKENNLHKYPVIVSVTVNEQEKTMCDRFIQEQK